jgi:hypothetical protein
MSYQQASDLDEILWNQVLTYNPRIKERKDIIGYYVDTSKKEFIITVRRNIPALKKIFPDKVFDNSGIEYKVVLRGLLAFAY